MRTLLKSLAAVLVGGVCSAAPLLAQTTQINLYQPWQLSGSATLAILNTDIRVDATDGSFGTTLDAEDDLGLSKTIAEPRFSARWRPWHRHEFELGYQFARRTSQIVLGRSITVQDSVYNLGATIDTRLNTDQASFAYRFAVFAKQSWQAGLALGLGALFVRTDITAVGTVSGTATGEAQRSQSEKLTGPTGSLGLYGRFLTGERWYWEVEARYIQLSVDRFDGRVGEGGAVVRYAAWSNVMLEGGYGFSAIKVDVAPRTRATGEQGFASGQIKYSLQNVRLAVVYTP
jgi:hypothetical protein